MGSDLLTDINRYGNLVNSIWNESQKAENEIGSIEYVMSDQKKWLNDKLSQFHFFMEEGRHKEIAGNKIKAMFDHGYKNQNHLIDILRTFGFYVLFSTDQYFNEHFFKKFMSDFDLSYFNMNISRYYMYCGGIEWAENI